jgi:hypothetical protein
MRRHLLALAAALAAAAPLSPALAEPAARFDALLGRAERVGDLGLFLGRFIGSCDDPFERAACERNVESARRSLKGKVMAVTLGEEALGVVRPELRGDRYRIVMTPFFDRGGYALTHGAPRRQDAAGRPLIDLLVMEGELPSGMMDMEFTSAFRTGNVRLEVVFTPESVWKLPRRGEPGSYEGVRARFLGVRLLDARSGNVLAERLMPAV